jgi:hypothetical protein
MESCYSRQTRESDVALLDDDVMRVMPVNTGRGKL